MTRMERAFRPDSRPPGWFAAALASLLHLAAACQSEAPAPREPQPFPPQAEAPVAPREADDLSAARALAASGDLNAALNALDAARSRHGDDPEFWRLYGDTTLAFAAERTAAGERSPGLIQALYEDAARAFERAAALAPGSWEPLVGLSRCRRAAGDSQGAWRAATAADALADPDPAPLLEELGHAGLSATVDAVRAGQPVPAAARRAEEALRALAGSGDAAATASLSDLLAWRGLRAEAREVLVEALRGAPGDPVLLARLKNLGLADPAAYVADLERVRAAAPGDATLLWYLGEARYQDHLAARGAKDFLRAYEALDRAEECFLASMAAEPEYRESCLQFLHLVRTARGWVLREEGRGGDAARTFLAALDADPERLETRPDPGTLLLGLYTAVGDCFSDGRLEDARWLLRRMTAIHGGNPDWWNNYAFACRELGVAATGRGAPEEARALFEESWQAYGQAVALAPEDPRLVNDRALIAVYHLDHDLDLAESELHRAIGAGTRLLAELAPDSPPERRRALEEAVGDAWENLAYLDVVRRRRGDRAEEYLEQSVRYFPYAQRSGVARLRAALERLRAPSAPAPGTPPSGGG